MTPHDIFIIDDKHPEDIAMLQALYSRSPASVTTQLEKLAKHGSGKFMNQFYVGYGHSSIGDCGTTTCFIEQVSMLVAKAIQDNPLYNGQEASTRYLDFSKQSIVDPYNHPESIAIQIRWMALYNETLPKVINSLKTKHPFNLVDYKSETTWNNTINARAFDICRSLLPLGTTTLLSWSTSLRAARDHLRKLKHHPLPEVQNVARSLSEELRKKYPNSFKEKDSTIDATSENDMYAQRFALQNQYMMANVVSKFSLTETDLELLRDGEVIVNRDAIDIEGIKKNEYMTVSSRPKYSPLPWRLESYGKYNFLFLLDFGSFRDIQRHRNGVCQHALVNGDWGMHPWYMLQFEDHLSSVDFFELSETINDIFHAITVMEIDKPRSEVLDQYLYPMGTMTLVHVAYSAPETIYVGEIRSGQTVHPSLRPIAQQMLNIIKSDIPGMAIHGDFDIDKWSSKRGEQTIVSSKVEV